MALTSGSEAGHVGVWINFLDLSVCFGSVGIVLGGGIDQSTGTGNMLEFNPGRAPKQFIFQSTWPKTPAVKQIVRKIRGWGDRCHEKLSSLSLSEAEYNFLCNFTPPQFSSTKYKILMLQPLRRVRKLHALEIARYWGETQRDSFYWWDKCCCGHKELFLPSDPSFMFCVDSVWKHQGDYILLCESAGKRMLALFAHLWYVPSPKKCLSRTQGTNSWPGSSLVHASWNSMVCISLLSAGT